MRALIAIIVSTAGILAGVNVARAADIPRPGSGYYPATRAYPLIGHRAVPYVVYDFEPGIAVRPYWLQPWAYRHYYPTGRDVRRHRVRAVVGRPRPAAPYERYWSTGPGFVRELPGYFESLPPPRWRGPLGP